jgi:asparagine synthase (glutamine-hydrolysing)
MCGIAGIYHKSGINADKGIIQAMTAALVHRGPDEEGFHYDGNVHLGSRRLSIIDLSAGSQPVYNHDGSKCIIFNGEVYNFLAIRQELIALGYNFQTHTDTEVILQAYGAWGEKCLDRFNGMFAFSIWDAKEQELFLARDRFGIKPLYYSLLGDGTFLFASEIKALLRHPAIRKEIYPTAINNLLTFGFNLAPHTFFQNIKQVLPGHFCRVSPAGVSSTLYWDIALDTPWLQADQEEIGELFRDKLAAAIELGVIADVPVASYLSGGIDSSAITGIYSQQASHPIKTITITFAEAGYDEREYSRKVSDYFQTENLEFQCAIEADEISNLIYYLENPLGTLLNLPLYLLSKKAREAGFKVVLSGEGSDEILGGYDYFKLLKSMAFIARSGSDGRKIILKRLYPELASSFEVELQYLRLKINSNEFPVAHPAIPYRFQEFPFKRELYSPDFIQTLRDNPLDNPFYFDLKKMSHRSLMDQALYLETKLRLLNLTLLLGDKMSMANSVELRPLFLDHNFVDFIFQIPSYYKLRGLNEKYILKKSLSGFLPPEICQRRKQPLQPPAPWFIKTAGDLLKDCLHPRKIKEAGYFNPEFVSSILAEFEKNSRIDYSGAIVVVFFMQLWHEIFLT